MEKWIGYVYNGGDFCGKGLNWREEAVKQIIKRLITGINQFKDLQWKSTEIFFFQQCLCKVPE